MGGARALGPLPGTARLHTQQRVGCTTNKQKRRRDNTGGRSSITNVQDGVSNIIINI